MRVAGDAACPSRDGSVANPGIAQEGLSGRPPVQRGLSTVAGNSQHACVRNPRESDSAEKRPWRWFGEEESVSM